ncbi:hypothetical protein L596_001897 [Steinernema carpocapsae]|uniref:Uncharacterized protein n=1 Tax=Steinernema carpocapsae TaxID=34508 RepID=A0A4U8UMG4_STECR|nr:hypothetical protein L596_001897 [Steinernema carpocapsae]
MVKLKESREQRMRDEQLFNTLREILWFIVSLVIILAISYFSRDSYSCHYQSKMRNLLNIDIPKDPPKNVTLFIKVTKASQF